ncbi:MAG: DNA polymerase I [Candidatus Jacksonbacteria bacterium]|nr:DNA polymerase I [Candidatus Jacksonbacteria bacterium]
MAKKRKKLLVVDALALLHRSWHAIPPTMKTKDGEVVNAVYGVTSALLKALKDVKPTYAVMTFDEKGPTFRNKMYKEYKAHREKKPDELYAQIPRVKEISEALGIPAIGIQGFEADDVIGTLSEKFKSETEVVILTGDLDTLQLVDDHVSVYTFKHGVKEMFTYDEAAVVDRYELVPDQMIDYKGLRGDPSDNIPGVAGIGEKGAINLIKEFKTLEGVYEFLEKETDEAARKEKGISKGMATKLENGKKDAEMSKALATIKCDVSVSISLEDSEWGKADQKAAHEIFQELEFRSLIYALEGLTEKKEAPGKESIVKVKEIPRTKGYHLLQEEKEINEFLEKLSQQPIFAFDTETTSLNKLQARVIGASFCWKAGDAYYIPFLGDDRPEYYKELVKILENPAQKKVAHNAKYDISVLANHGINVQGSSFDTMIAAYVLRPDARSYSLDNLAFVECKHQMIPISDLIGKRGKGQLSLDQVEIEDVSEYAAEDADYTWRLYEIFKKDIKDDHLKTLLEDIEMPLVEVLAKVERNGVKLDSKFLKKMGEELSSKLLTIEKKIIKFAGKEFNVNSPSQLSVVLFETLKLSTSKVPKRTKGFSTASDVLEKLKDEHEIIPLIMEYRELSKLNSTYVVALPALVDKDTGRLHTDYNQTVAATGRLSSSHPNLQNIPIRTELGRKIRNAFVAPPGKALIAIDYSQIELRLAAHLANDKKMIEIFENGRDIHKETAASINNVPVEDVTADMRRAAKEVNFGVLYGMGWLGLSKRTGISRDEARSFISGYFALFPRVAEYMEEIKEQARELGYVETAFGRRRYTPDMHANAPQLRSAAERMAINMPLQGTAADLMKLAMIRIDKKLEKDELMILQVHDELVFEVPEDKVKKVSKMVVEEMETAGEFKVPIVAEVKVGKNWGEMTSE